MNNSIKNSASNSAKELKEKDATNTQEHAAIKKIIASNKNATDEQLRKIRFGYVNGKESAVPVKVNDDLSKELNRLAEKVIKLNKKGIKITITNINEIIKKLNEEN